MNKDMQNPKISVDTPNVFLTPPEQIAQTLAALQMCDITGYLRTIETTSDWVAYKDPIFDFNSASMRESRFNMDGQSAFYIASGDHTAKANVPDWEKKVKCKVEPQLLNCFDLPAFAKANGLSEQYRKCKVSGGYLLPQATADYLLEKQGVTGILYTSAAADEGCCAVIRQPNDGKIGPLFISVKL